MRIRRASGSKDSADKATAAISLCWPAGAASFRRATQSVGAGGKKIRQIGCRNCTGPGTVAKQAVDGLAQRYQARLFVSSVGDRQCLAVQLCCAEAAGRSGKSRKLDRIVKSVERPLRISAQDHRIGDIQRQRAAGKTMFGPIHGHASQSNRQTEFDKLDGIQQSWLEEGVMLYFLQQLLNGLHAGSLYALLAFGYVITNGVLHRTNLAYGPIFAFCGHAMIMATLFAYDGLRIILPLSLLLGAILAFGYAAMASSVLSRFVLQPLAGRSPNTVVAATLGVAIVLAELSRIAADTKDIWLPPILSIPVDLAPPGAFRVTLTLNQLLGAATVFCAIGFGTVALRISSFGRRWRAVSDDPLAAAMCGVDVTRTFRQSVLAGAIAAALTGILAALYYGNISFGTGMIYGLKILFVTAAGSYSSPLRAAIGAACYGIGEALWTGYFPGEWRDGWMLAFLVVILVLREPEADNKAPAAA